MESFFLQGERRAGKTQQLLRACAASRLSLAGFVTVREEKDGRLVFALAPAALLAARLGEAASPEAAAAGVETTPFIAAGPGGPRFDAPCFRRRALELIAPAAELTVFDEIGGLELLDDAFYAALLERLAGPGLALFSFKSERSLGQMLDRLDAATSARETISARRRTLLSHAAALHTVTPARRDEALAAILAWLDAGRPNR